MGKSPRASLVFLAALVVVFNAGLLATAFLNSNEQHWAVERGSSWAGRRTTGTTTSSWRGFSGASHSQPNIYGRRNSRPIRTLQQIQRANYEVAPFIVHIHSKSITPIPHVEATLSRTIHHFVAQNLARHFEGEIVVGFVVAVQETSGGRPDNRRSMLGRRRVEVEIAGTVSLESNGGGSADRVPDPDQLQEVVEMTFLGENALSIMYELNANAFLATDIILVSPLLKGATVVSTGDEKNDRKAHVLLIVGSLVVVLVLFVSIGALLWRARGSFSEDSSEQGWNAVDTKEPKEDEESREGVSVHGSLDVQCEGKVVNSTKSILPPKASSSGSKTSEDRTTIISYRHIASDDDGDQTPPTTPSPPPSEAELIPSVPHNDTFMLEVPGLSERPGVEAIYSEDALDNFDDLKAKLGMKP